MAKVRATSQSWVPEVEVQRRERKTGRGRKCRAAGRSRISNTIGVGIKNHLTDTGLVEGVEISVCSTCKKDICVDSVFHVLWPQSDSCKSADRWTNIRQVNRRPSSDTAA